eukprot:2790806-Pyramimonas_sp.AAC.1
MSKAAVTAGADNLGEDPSRHLSDRVYVERAHVQALLVCWARTSRSCDANEETSACSLETSSKRPERLRAYTAARSASSEAATASRTAAVGCPGGHPPPPLHSSPGHQASSVHHAQTVGDEGVETSGAP